jgi:hypothetical protein
MPGEEPFKQAVQQLFVIDKQDVGLPIHVHLGSRRKTRIGKYITKNSAMREAMQNVGGNRITKGRRPYQIANN